jgi:hypothetical protein
MAMAIIIVTITIPIIMSVIMPVVIGKGRTRFGSSA